MAPAPAPAPATVVVPPATTVAPAVPSDRVVYPEGRWQLYGDGRSTPYYWVWIPSGATLTTVPSPPTRPAGSAVVSNSDRTYSFREGRWQLYGDGGATPYYWVWIPTGSTLTTAPAPPARPATTAVVPQSDRTYTFTEGRWQLFGDGGATPYYWVWIPSGMTPPAPPMPPQAG